MTAENSSRRASVPSESVFDMASKTFELLVSGPEPLAVDGGLFDGFPRRAVPLDELAELMLGRRCAAEVTDAVWAHLVGRSRAEGGAWTVACVGMALPGLIICAKKLAGWASDPADVHAAVLTGFLTALASLKLDRPWVLNRLVQAARRAGQRAVREELSAPTPVEDGFESRQPPAPWGHPDLVLAEAVAAEVISPDEADLIGATRLEDVSAEDYAAAHGLNVSTFRGVRWRAESRLVAWLTDNTADADTTGPGGDGNGRHPAPAGDGANPALHAAPGAVEVAGQPIGEHSDATTGSPPGCVPPVPFSAPDTTAVRGHTNARRPGDRRPPTQPHRHPASRTVTGPGRGRGTDLGPAGQQNGDFQPN